jgi:hypothetical protein
MRWLAWPRLLGAGMHAPPTMRRNYLHIRVSSGARIFVTWFEMQRRMLQAITHPAASSLAQAGFLLMSVLEES